MEKKRMVFIDLLKCIAIFFVVLYHSNLYSYDFLKDSNFINYLLYYLRTILSTCTPLFFLVNGYLLFGKMGVFNLKKHIFKTIKLTILGVVWGIITLLILQVVKDEWFSLYDFFRALWSWRSGWINHLWYIGALVCVYIFFPLLKQVYDTNKRIFFYFTCISAVLTLGNTFLNNFATVCAGIIMKKDMVFTVSNFFNIFNPYRGIFGYAFVYFCVGGNIFHLQDKIESISVKKKNIIAVFGIVISCMGLFGIGICYSKLTGEIWDVVWNGYATIFTFLNVLFIFILCLNWKVDNLCIRQISSNTLGIYFIHYIIIRSTKPYLKGIIFFQNLPFNIIYALIVILACVIISSCIKKIPLLSKLLN